LTSLIGHKPVDLVQLHVVAPAESSMGANSGPSAGERNVFMFKFGDYEDEDAFIHIRVELGPTSVFMDFKVDHAKRTLTLYLVKEPWYEKSLFRVYKDRNMKVTLTNSLD